MDTTSQQSKRGALDIIFKGRHGLICASHITLNVELIQVHPRKLLVFWLAAKYEMKYLYKKMFADVDDYIKNITLKLIDVKITCRSIGLRTE